MYSDLFDALGNGGGNNRNAAGGGSNNNRDGSGGGTSDANKPLLTFNAGKVDLSLQEDGKYWAAPDTRRGEVMLKYDDDGRLTWEWYDRREKKVVDTILITDPVKLERADVPKSSDADANDRVYYWKLDGTWRMIWLQDKKEEEGLIDKVNDILKVPKKKKPEGGDAAAAAAAPGDGPVSARSPGNASTSSASTTTRQVDALSNILENLGMPQQQGEGARNAAAGAAAATGAPGASAAAAGGGAGGGTLTLADLQGVMAGLQQQQQAPPAGLHDVVSSEAVDDLLANEDVRDRLIRELPEGQRSAEHLEENLRSPQIQQTLRALTAALMPDDNGSMDGYHSVLANFHLDAADGQRALAESNNPIQAFLDCVLASVKKDETKEESKDEEMKE